MNRGPPLWLGREGADLSFMGNTLTAMFEPNMVFPFLMGRIRSSRFVGRNQNDSASRILTRVQPLEFERRERADSRDWTRE